jgi:hypothetical protein
MGRLIVVVVLLGFVGVSWTLHRRRLLAAQRVAAGDRLPAELREPSAPRTWVLVTAPMCASCGPAEDRLRELDPGARLVRVDASQRPDLARALRVRAAPTLLLAGPDGHIRHRLAGPEAVDAELSAAVRASAHNPR